MTTAVDARKFQLAVVRTRDVRALRESGPPAGIELPNKHGDPEDPRYPSPQNLRTVVGFTVDVLLHLACAAGVALALWRNTTLSNVFVLLVAAPATYFVASFVHRVFVQRILHTTVGKALVGLRLIRDDTGGPPTLWSLTKAWLMSTLGVVLQVIAS